MESYCSDVRVWIKGLVVACPLNNALPNCPFKDARKLPLIERIGVVNRMSVEQLEEIINHHKECLQMRER